MEPETPAQVVDPQTAPAPAVVADDPAARLAIVEKELKEARSEAAKYRTTLRSQEQAQADAEAQRLKEAGEFKALYEKEQAARAELEAKVTQAQRTQLQLDAAIAAGLPPSMAPRLVGATADELAADAAALATQFKVTPPVPPSTGPSNPPADRKPQPPAYDPKRPVRLSDIDWKK